MPYVHITRSAIDMADYESVRKEMGDAPVDGQIAHLVGRADGQLQIIDLWNSKADADRFAAERLFPAFERSGTRPGPDASYTAFEADVVELRAAGTIR